MVPMADRIPLNPDLSFTDNSTHGASGEGSLDSHNATPMAAKVVAIPNVGRTMTIKEFPSQNAGIEYGGDEDVVNPMDTD